MSEELKIEGQGLFSAIRCVVCRVVFNGIVDSGIKRCPNCETPVSPEHISDDVEIKINWHELKILFMWAEQWALCCRESEIRNNCPPEVRVGDMMRDTLQAIADIIQDQHPQLIKLTMAGELGQLRDLGLNIVTNVPGVDGASLPDGESVQSRTVNYQSLPYHHPLFSGSYPKLENRPPPRACGPDDIEPGQL